MSDRSWIHRDFAGESTRTQHNPSEAPRQTLACPKCGGAAFQVGSSANSWRCQACGAESESPHADSRGFFPGIRNE